MHKKITHTYVYQNLILVNDESYELMHCFFFTGPGGAAKSVLEKIKTPFELFDHLRNVCKLSRDNLLFLQAMLFHANRIDLFKKLMTFGKKHKTDLHFYEPPGNPGKEINIY